MSTDIESRGRDAAAAARGAVVPVVVAAWPRFRRHRRRPTRSIALVLAAACLVVGLVVAVALSSTDRTVSTGPASNASVTTTPLLPPPTTPPWSTPGTLIASGRASDGRIWSLFIGGPSNDICLTVDVADGSGLHTGACAGAPFGAPAPDPYQGHVADDSRIIPMVFGRVAPGVVSVEVVLAQGQLIGPRPVIDGTGGPFYVVEVPSAERPVAIVGHRPDGTTVRYSVSS